MSTNYACASLRDTSTGQGKDREFFPCVRLLALLLSSFPFYFIFWSWDSRKIGKVDMDGYSLRGLGFVYVVQMTCTTNTTRNHNHGWLWGSMAIDIYYRGIYAYSSRVVQWQWKDKVLWELTNRKFRLDDGFMHEISIQTGGQDEAWRKPGCNVRKVCLSVCALPCFSADGFFHMAEERICVTSPPNVFKIWGGGETIRWMVDLLLAGFNTHMLDSRKRNVSTYFALVAGRVAAWCNMSVKYEVDNKTVKWYRFDLISILALILTPSISVELKNKTTFPSTIESQVRKQANLNASGVAISF